MSWWTAAQAPATLRAVRWLPRALFAALLLLPLLAVVWLAHRSHVQLGWVLWHALRPAAAADAAIEPHSATRATPRRIEWLGTTQNERLTELSGLAVSRRNDDLLWAVNDSGDEPRLYALGKDGRDRGVLRVRGATNNDWEDLAAFTFEGESYLLIGDVGDNLAWRSEVTLYIVPEPPLVAERFASDAEVSPVRVLRVRYPDGPLDCESVAVDVTTRQILLLSKRTTPPVLYALPLELGGAAKHAANSMLLAQRLTPVMTISDQDSVPTSMDIAADGSQAIVITYHSAYLFARRPDESWQNAFARTPSRLRMPRMRAMEAVALAPDGQTIFASSEGWPAPIYRVDPPAAAPAAEH